MSCRVGIAQVAKRLGSRGPDEVTWVAIWLGRPNWVVFFFAMFLDCALDYRRSM
jgi:hypothetical protein